MASLISSYILEPVARQARRFSGQGQASNAVAGENTEAPEPTTSSGERSMSIDHEVSSVFDNENEGDLESATRHLSISASSNTVLPDAPTTESPQHEVSPFDTAMENVSPLENVPAYRRSSSTDLRRRVSENARRTTDNSFRGTASFAQQQRDSQYQHQRSRNPSHSSLFNNQVDTEMGAESPRNRQSSLTGEEMDDSHQENGRDDRALPEDDGMSVMRKKILEINDLAASAEEKSKRMHQLMMEAYGAHMAQKTSSLSQTKTQPDPNPTTPHTQAQAQPIPIEKKVVSTKDWIFSVGKSPPPQVDIVYPAPTAEDLRPTFYPTPRRNTRGSRTNSLDEETLPVLGCPHYKRNVKMQCSQCQKWYTCRFCHDAAEPHTLERRATKRMLCMLCGTAQPASKTCIKCKEVAAWYYCDICKLWNNDHEKPTYHCDDCGICRQGVRSDFFHCKTCKVCLSLSLSDKHRCIERSMDCDCPICGEYLFTSRRTVVFMRCGHSIHFHCYKEHLQSSYKCPICSRSVMNMEMMFRHLDRAIEAQPMPDEYTDTKALVYCNDCLTKTTVPYHWLGLKCEVCHSYNTAQVQILPSNNSATSPAPPSPPPDAIPHFPQAMPPDLIPRGRRSTADSMRSRPSRQSSISMAIASVDADGQVDAVPTPMLERMYENMDLDAEGPDDLDFWGREANAQRTAEGHETRDSDDDDEYEDDEDEDTVDGRSARESDQDADDNEDDLFSIPGHI